MSRVLAVCEQRDGALRKVSYETVTAAGRVAEALGGEVEALVLGTGPVADAGALARYGPAAIVVLTAQGLDRAPEAAAQAVVAHARQREYTALVFAASATGKDLASRVAAALDVALAQDVTEVSAQDGDLLVVRPVYAGKALQQVRVTTRPALVAVRPNVFTPVERPGVGAVEQVAVDVGTGRVTVREVKAAPAGALDVAEAPIVVSGGRGLKEPANFELLEELAAAFGGSAAVGASRAVVDAGWRPHADQVGQTGKTVSPSLYIAVGISGAVQHLAGMRTAKVIVAINKDRDAPIFKIADYGIVGDLFEVVPVLTEAIRQLHD